MKKLGLGILLAAVCIIIVLPAFAQDPEKEKGSMTGMDKKMMMGKEDCMPHMMGMMHMMGHMVATGDGGVIVMMGNKLYKYDKDLNLKKEVEIKIDMKKMHKMMKHQMMPDGKKENSKMPGDSEETSGH
ncbi:MAG TPA: hypothetical protein VMU29_10695 [Smithella sp.]|nr:hypothetical protein [Smithella sp.]